MSADWYPSKNAAFKAMKLYDGLFEHERSITIGRGYEAKEYLVFKGSRGGKNLVTPAVFKLLITKKNKKRKMKTNTLSPPPKDDKLMVVPTLQRVVNLREAISRIPECMSRLGSRPLVEWDWNLDHGCYEQNDCGYIELHPEEQESYELREEGFQALKIMARSVGQTQKMTKALMQVVAGEDTFGLIFSYNQNNLDETNQCLGAEAMFLRAIKEIPDVSYKILPVLIHEKHMCTCDSNAADDDEDFENDCGCISEVYSATPEDIQYSLSQAGKEYLIGHPSPLGGGATNFYSIGDFGYSWKKYFGQGGPNNIIKERITLCRAIMVTAWSPLAHKKRKCGDDSKCPLCECDEPKECYIRKSNTKKNPNKSFYTCRTGKCKFFQWI